MKSTLLFDLKRQKYATQMRNTWKKYANKATFRFMPLPGPIVKQ
jgi:hypothetical protein